VKTIGVLGGLGPQATMDFEARIHTVSQRLIPQRWGSGYPPMLVYYFRHSPVVLGDDFRPVFPAQPDPRLLDAAKRLGEWVDFLVITANAPHMFHEQIERAAECPILSMIEVTMSGRTMKDGRDPVRVSWRGKQSRLCADAFAQSRYGRSVFDQSASIVSRGGRSARAGVGSYEMPSLPPARCASRCRPPSRVAQ
jgi:hypothetical protein